MTTIQPLATFIANTTRDGICRSAGPWEQALQCDEDAYQVQDRVGVELGWFKPGEVQFWMSGGPTRFDPLSHARLPLHTVRPSGTNLSDLTFRCPYVQAGVALRLGQSVTSETAARITESDVESLINSMAVAIEVSDSRWSEQWDASPLLRLADTGSHGALVLDEWRPYERRHWAKQTCKVEVGKSSVVFKGTYGLEDPAWLLPIWLRHATRDGRTVPAGSAVFTGSWSGGIACSAFTPVRVSFADLGQAKLSLG